MACMETSTHNQIHSECCDADARVLGHGTYDPDDDGMMQRWYELECQTCGSVYFSAVSEEQI